MLRSTARHPQSASCHILSWIQPITQLDHIFPELRQNTRCEAFFEFDSRKHPDIEADLDEEGLDPGSDDIGSFISLNPISGLKILRTVFIALHDYVEIYRPMFVVASIDIYERMMLRALPYYEVFDFKKILVPDPQYESAYRNILMSSHTVILKRR